MALPGAIHRKQRGAQRLAALLFEQRRPRNHLEVAGLIKLESGEVLVADNVLRSDCAPSIGAALSTPLASRLSWLHPASKASSDRARVASPHC